MKKFISILGSTGSIGLSSLKILDRKKNYLKPFLFSANKNFNLICKQIRKYKPLYFFINDKKTFQKIKKKFKNENIRIINNIDTKSFKYKSDITIAAIPGIAGLSPTIKMINKSNKMLLANKESIICGWELIKKASLQFNTTLIPIDSEHFSIFKLIENIKIDQIKKIYLTASGGPFLDLKIKKLKKIKPQHALKHPKWKMGKKITVDSATLMNKVFEYIEAQKLFNIPEKKLDILIHPESLVHAIVKLKNGLTKFIYHDTSMIIPLANAIFEKNLEIDNFLKDDKTIRNLTFKLPDKKKFPVIKNLNKFNEFPSTPIIVNASNELLVDQFLRKKVPFLAIPIIIDKILRDRNYRKYAIRKPKDLEQINEINLWAKTKTLEKIQSIYG